MKEKMFSHVQFHFSDASFPVKSTVEEKVAKEDKTLQTKG